MYVAHHYGDFMRKRKYIMVSGGFDPVHVGHLRMFQEAAKLADGLYVVINSDDWLMRKKGYVFMTFAERAEIIQGFKGVTAVVSVDDSDDTVCEALRRVRPDYFANGGDRTADNTPEMELCEELGIEMVWNVGGEKVQSSSELVSNSNDIVRVEANHTDSAKKIDLYESYE